jgi:hypothetical protein
MKRHLVEFEIEGQKIYYISSELYQTIESLKNEDKLIGVVFSDNEIKIVEIEDYFDIRYENILRNNLTIVLDSNLFITARSIYKYSNINSPERKYFASLLVYSKFLDALFDPTICMYEFGNKPNHNAVDDLYKFRVVDNLSFETVLDLYCGKTHSISKSDWDKVKKRTRKINKSEVNEDCNKTLTRFNQNYPYMLKTAILLRMKGIGPYNKIDFFFQWIRENFITKSDAIIFALYILYNDGGKIIKGHSTSDYTELIKLIQNATWDVTMISYLKDQVKKNPNRYYLLASLDRNLIKVGKYFLSPEENTFYDLFGKKKKDEIRNMIDRINEICSLAGRESIVKERLLNIDKTINDLENELKKSIK